MAHRREVDPSNAVQFAAWDGDEGAFWAANADRFDRSVAAYHDQFLDAAAIRPGDRVLDVGCGTGQTTRDAARRAFRGEAVGVDLSASMLDHARRRADAEGLSNVAFLQADAQVHPFEAGAFDVVIGRTSAMFFGDHAAAFANLRRAMASNGRLALLTWQPSDRNPWLTGIATALAVGRPPRVPAPGAGPFSLSDPQRVTALLSGAGFVDVGLADRTAPMWFGDDTEEAFVFIMGVAGWMVDGLDDDSIRAAHEALRALLDAHTGPLGVTLGSATWIVTARAP